MPADPAQRLSAYVVRSHVVVLGVVLVAVVLDSHFATPIGEVEPQSPQLGHAHPQLWLGCRQPRIDDLHPNPRLPKGLRAGIGVLDELAELGAATSSAEPRQHCSIVGVRETAVTHEGVENTESLPTPAQAREIARRAHRTGHPDARHVPDLIRLEIALAAVYAGSSSAVVPVDADDVEVERTVERRRRLAVDPQQPSRRVVADDCVVGDDPPQAGGAHLDGERGLPAQVRTPQDASDHALPDETGELL